MINLSVCCRNQRKVKLSLTKNLYLYGKFDSCLVTLAIFKFDDTNEPFLIGLVLILSSNKLDQNKEVVLLGCCSFTINLYRSKTSIKQNMILQKRVVFLKDVCLALPN